MDLHVSGPIQDVPDLRAERCASLHSPVTQRCVLEGGCALCHPEMRILVKQLPSGTFLLVK